jgi:hypothetical protein
VPGKWILMEKVRRLSVRVPKKKIAGKSGMSAIKCLCGAVILLVPNARVMSIAIESHVAKHQQEVKDPKEAQAEAERIRDDLITKILEKASKS